MIAHIKSIAGWLRSRKVELGLGVRVTVAAMGALAIALALGLKLPLWAVLTSIIVTQMSVGRSLKATRDYLIGTVGGALYGAAVAILIPHSGEGALLAVLVLAVAPLAFIAALNPSLNVATITAIIVLLLPIMSHADVIDSAIDRVLEVTVGALTGLLVSFVVLPSRAHSQVRASASHVLELMASALNELLSGLTRGRELADGQAAARDLTRSGRVARLRRGGRRGAQRGSDKRGARRCRGTLLCVGIFAGADAAEPEGPGALRRDLGGFTAG